MSVRVERPADPAHVAVVTIDRPRAANALDPPALRGLADAWRRIAADHDVRCAVLTGAGERVFCAGMDMTTTIPAAQRLARGERVDDEAFAALREVGTVAGAIAANAPLAVRATWRGVRELLHRPLPDAYRRQEELGRPLRGTADAREAQRAFVEKRRPVWTGR